MGNTRGAVRLVAAIALLAFLYFVTGRLGLLLAIPPGYATAIWPASGIALAALLLYGYRLWPGVLIGSFLVNVPTSFDPSAKLTVFWSLLVPASIGVGAALQALVGAFLIKRFIDLDSGLTRARSVLGFLIVGGPLSCLVSASWGLTTLWSTGRIPISNVPFSWMTWWVGDTIGVVVVVPLVFIWLGNPPDAWRRRKIGVALPLALSLVAAIAMFVTASEAEQRRIEAEYEHEAVIIGDSFENILFSYLEVLHSIQNLFAASISVDRWEFRRFVGPTLERIPAIQALSWNPLVSLEQLTTFEEYTRRQGLPDFQVTESDPAGRLVRAARRPTYFVVSFIEPYSGNEAALGFDVYSNPARRTAMDVARDSGEPVATPRIKLVQEQGSQAGVLVFLPLYTSGDIPPDIAARRASLLGYAVGVFRLGDVLTAALDGLSAPNIEARLTDASATAADQQLALLRLDAQGQAEMQTTDDNKVPPDTELSWTANYDFGGRTWSLTLTAMPQYVADRRSWAAWGVLTGGLAFTGLLGAFLLILTGRLILDERRAAELTSVNASLKNEITQRERTERALYAEKERAEVTLHSIGDAVITTDTEGRIDFMNPVAERLLEWTTDEAAGQPLASVFRIINEETRMPAADPVRRCLQEDRVIGLANHTVLLSRSGCEYSIDDSAAPIRGPDGRMIGIVLIFHDVTESRRMAREAAHYASHDSLTELCNRREFDRRVEHAVVGSKLNGTHHSLCYLDLDQFKIVNDVAGHRAGDELLKHIGPLLSPHVRSRDTIARLGGDEFGVLLENCPIDKGVEIAEALVAAVRAFKFIWEHRSYDVGVSIGIVAITSQAQTAEELLTHADVACYAAKDAGRGRVHVYQTDSDGSDPRHREILRAAEMRSALERNRFRIYCQPIFSLSSGEPRPARYELLLRLLDDDDQIVLPGSFIPSAERYGIMQSIDRWVVRTAFRDFEALFSGQRDTMISINLSGNSLNNGDLFTFLGEAFSEYAISPAQVCFEITETAVIRNLTAAGRLISSIRDLGGQFALDDFGVGLSSFAYLKNLPVDYLKIDGSLVRNISVDRNDRAMVEAINQVAQRLGMKTVAEYAETEAAVNVLREIDVDFAQGHALGRATPLPVLL